MTPEEFWSILHQEPVVYPIFYRLYYNDEGFPLYYSMEDLPGQYIDIDQPTYSRSPSNVKVINNKLVEISLSLSEKIIPGDDGTSCHPDDVSIVDPTSTVKWSKKTYESN